MAHKKQHRWQIFLIRKRGAYLGTVEAIDAEAAIHAAIAEFEINDPERQKRLSAQRIS
jgi:hypothetical protein